MPGACLRAAATAAAPRGAGCILFRQGHEQARGGCIDATTTLAPQSSSGHTHTYRCLSSTSSLPHPHSYLQFSTQRCPLQWCVAEIPLVSSKLIQCDAYPALLFGRRPVSTTHGIGYSGKYPHRTHAFPVFIFVRLNTCRSGPCGPR